MKTKYYLLSLFIIFLVTCSDTDQDQTLIFGNDFPTTVEIEEEKDSSVNPLSLLTLTATDTEGGSITYSLDQNSINRDFTINSNTGEIVYAGTGFDYESITSHTLTVTASNSLNAQTATQDITVQILGVNEFAPRFIRDDYSTTIPETTAVGEIIIEASVDDPDRGDTHVYEYYSLDGEDDPPFYIESDSGLIKVGRPLDYEAKNFYSNAIKATDSGGLSHDGVRVLITILDVVEE